MSGGFRREEFIEVIYLDTDGSSSNSGKDAQNAKSLEDQVILTLPAGSVVTEAAFIVTTAISGTSALNIGESGGDTDGYVANADVTLGTAGSYRGFGALVSSGASGVQTYYSAAQDIALDVTGTALSGDGVAVIKGYRV